MARWGLFGAVALCLVAAPVCADSVRQDIRARLPDGRTLRFACAGEGSPTVLMESGFAADADAWYKVQPVLANDTRVCSYDRAGYGASDPAPPPRDGAAIARDLDQGLRAARIYGPFVLVGHSAGGLYVQIFAARRPRDVVGMVLVDPSVAHQDQRFADFGPNAASLAPLKTRALACVDVLSGARPAVDAGEQARCAKTARGPGFVSALVDWRTQAAELDALWDPTSEETPTGAGSLGALPLIVLTAGGDAAAPSLAQQIFEARWSALHQEVAARSTVGQERVVAGATHLIMIDHPQAVISAVREVVAAGRARPAPRGG